MCSHCHQSLILECHLLSSSHSTLSFSVKLMPPSSLHPLSLWQVQCPLHLPEERGYLAGFWASWSRPPLAYPFCLLIDQKPLGCSLSAVTWLGPRAGVGNTQSSGCGVFMMLVLHEKSARSELSVRSGMNTCSLIQIFIQCLVCAKDRAEDWK